ncbi:SMC-Scp complex subunit ScpB [Micromonospora sp. LAH09]|uniref:SMC-Scp complex subunit ScpB n=1 Tax=Micromonospora cabrerizensis TaxID=2911213 RepID=UPI001EE8A8C3|nr:SMC-Scp complex subunit ScpB [Micromonospora cabrerizensis]MCG5472989.1 SMC-Scp complex subunit ScpB [Micromonospora cabrerizensis]
MSDEERRDSLADQAAAWVPPWERPRPPAPASTATPPDDSAEPPEADTEDLPAEPSLPGPITSGAAEVDPGGPGSAAVEPAAVEPAAVEPAPVEPAPVEPAPVEPAPVEPVPVVVGEGSAGESGGAGDVPRRQAAGRRRVTATPEPAPELSDTELRGALEAILLVVDEPVSELVLAQVLEQPAERVGPMLDEIAAGYTAAGHGFELRRAAGGWRLYTRPEYATYVERFVLDGQSVRLTQAALETLAVVAYKQPVTRSRISAIRGVNCDGVIRTLVTRGLVEECGTETDSGAFLYKTTTLFLEKLGLNTVDELPPLAPFLPDDVEELADATR